MTISLLGACCCCCSGCGSGSWATCRYKFGSRTSSEVGSGPEGAAASVENQRAVKSEQHAKRHVCAPGVEAVSFPLPMSSW